MDEAEDWSLRIYNYLQTHKLNLDQLISPERAGYLQRQINALGYFNPEDASRMMGVEADLCSQEEKGNYEFVYPMSPEPDTSSRSPGYLYLEERGGGGSQYVDVHPPVNPFLPSPPPSAGAGIASDYLRVDPHKPAENYLRVGPGGDSSQYMRVGPGGDPSQYMRVGPGGDSSQYMRVGPGGDSSQYMRVAPCSPTAAKPASSSRTQAPATATSAAVPSRRGTSVELSALLKSLKDGSRDSDSDYCEIFPAADPRADLLTVAQVLLMEKLLAELLRGRAAPLAAVAVDLLAQQFSQRLLAVAARLEQLSLEELIELAGADAFSAWFSREAALFKASPRQVSPVLCSIRDKLARAIMESQRIQGRSLRVSPKDAKKLRYLDDHVLQALETHYCRQCGNKILQRCTFLNLGGQGSYLTTSDAKPNFKKFDRICNELLRHISMATAELLKGHQRLEPKVTFYITAKLVKDLERALKALGAAGNLELCPDGIRKAHVESMGLMIWKLGRVFGMRTIPAEKALGLTVNLIAALNRLGYLLDRVLHDRPPLVDMDQLHRNYRE